MTSISLEGVTWTPASSKLVTARVITVAIWMVPFIVAPAVFAMIFHPAWWWVSGGVVAAAVWFAWLGYRSATAHAWCEREDDLLIKRGRIFRSITAVPYGRMQYVEVSSGPLARALGISSLQLHTAAASTSASLSGVPLAEADALRDRLSARGEARMAGL